LIRRQFETGATFAVAYEGTMVTISGAVPGTGTLTGTSL
jgi:hypothetical protein